MQREVVARPVTWVELGSASPVAKLVPFSAEGADDQELTLVAAGKLGLPKVRLSVKELLKIPTGRVARNKAIQAVLADREEEL
jgi:hypothetical protein